MESNRLLRVCVCVDRSDLISRREEKKKKSQSNSESILVNGVPTTSPSYIIVDLRVLY
jgi:hypothetical protein